MTDGNSFPNTFDAEIGKLREDGLASLRLRRQVAWDEASEADKLAAIEWQAVRVSLMGEPVRGVDLLVAVERNVDYEGLPTAQGDRLRDLRVQIDAGRIDVSPSPRDLDHAWKAVSWTAGIEAFDRSLDRYKADGLYNFPNNIPWAEVSADRKASEIVGLALHRHPPGANALAAIEREVDYGQLSDGRREALEGLRAQIDAGGLEGIQPGDLGDRANHALRLAELEPRVAEYKVNGGPDARDNLRPWGALPEVRKLDLIVLECIELRLDFGPSVAGLIDREVDMARVPEARREGIEQAKLMATLGGEEYRRRQDAPYEPPDEASAAFKGRIEEKLWMTGYTDGADIWADWSDLGAEAKLHLLAKEMDWERVPESYFRTMVGRELDVADLPAEKRSALESPGANRRILSAGFEDANDEREIPPPGRPRSPSEIARESRPEPGTAGHERGGLVPRRPSEIAKARGAAKGAPDRTAKRENDHDR